MRSVGKLIIVARGCLQTTLMMRTYHEVSRKFFINCPSPTTLIASMRTYHEVSRKINNLINSRPTSLMMRTCHEVSRKYFINCCKGWLADNIDDENIS